MNHPRRDPLEEMGWMADLGLDFIDLTLEPPAASSDRVDVAALAEGLRRYRLGVVGHTPYYLPLASPIAQLQAAAEGEMRRCIDCFAALGAEWVNVHPDPHVPFASDEERRERNAEALGRLCDYALAQGTRLMLENIPQHFNTVAELGPLLDPLPALGLHLDLGHCNLHFPHSTAGELISRYGPRLRHVHLHDNKGGSADLHLPLGAGTLALEHDVALLKAAGYDGTITLEVFTPDTHYFEYSVRRLREVWGDA